MILSVVLLCLSGLVCQVALAGWSPTQSQETCDALTSLGTGNPDPQLACQAEDTCDHASCNVTSADATLNALGLQFTLTLLPCQEADAVAVEIVFFTETAGILDSTTYTEPITERTVLTITMTVALNQIASGIQLAISGSTSMGDFTLLPTSDIPVNRSECEEVEPSPTPSPSPSPSPSSSPAPSPTGLPTPETTCDALTEFVANIMEGEILTCEVNEDCDGLNCGALGFTAVMVVLPCNEPPGVSMKINDEDRIIITDDTTIQVPFGDATLPLNVTLDQLDGAIGVQLVTPLGALDYTKIPIDTSSCDEDDGSVMPGQSAAMLLVFATLVTVATYLQRL